jgi:hypothetical protein
MKHLITIQNEYVYSKAADLRSNETAPRALHSDTGRASGTRKQHFSFCVPLALTLLNWAYCAKPVPRVGDQYWVLLNVWVDSDRSPTPSIGKRLLNARGQMSIPNLFDNAPIKPRPSPRLAPRHE